MTTFLIRNRYRLFNYKKLFNSHTYGCFILTPYSSEFISILNKNNIFQFRITNTLLQFLFTFKYQSLFTSLIYFIAFDNLYLLFSILDNFEKYFKKNNLNYKLFFFKINNYFISLNFFIQLKRIKEINNYIIYYIINFLFLIFKLIFKNLFISFNLLLNKIKK